MQIHISTARLGNGPQQIVLNGAVVWVAPGRQFSLVIDEGGNAIYAIGSGLVPRDYQWHQVPAEVGAPLRHKDATGDRDNWEGYSMTREP